MSKSDFAFAAVISVVAAGAIPTLAHAAPCKLGTGSTAVNNTCIGTGALGRNTTGDGNTAMGIAALSSNTTGSYNTAIGASALPNNNVGSYNTATGTYALYSNYGGYQNSAFGASALGINLIGRDNTAFGFSALPNNTYGNNNIALGSLAGQNLQTGSNNIVIGSPGVAGDQNTIRLGTPGTQTRAFLAGIRGVNVTSGQSVVIDANGQLGVISSSRRYKQDIHTMGDASAALMQLQPVTFRYKQAADDGSKPLQYGLIAEEVEKVMPDLVIHDEDGAPEAVAYHLLPSLLLNEYQKQNRELAVAKAELASANSKLAQTTTRLEAMDAELAALKMVVSRLATGPTNIRLANSHP